MAGISASVKQQTRITSTTGDHFSGDTNHSLHSVYEAEVAGQEDCAGNSSGLH